MYRYNQLFKNADEIKRIRHLISERVAKAKVCLNFGFVEDAEDLLDICEMDINGTSPILNNHNFCKLDTSSPNLAELSQSWDYLYLIGNTCVTECLRIIVLLDFPYSFSIMSSAFLYVR